MYSLALISLAIYSCNAITIIRQDRVIATKSKIELMPVEIPCNINDMVMITAPTVNCKNPLYYLNKPNGKSIKLDFANPNSTHVSKSPTTKNNNYYDPNFNKTVAKYIYKNILMTPQVNMKNNYVRYNIARSYTEDIIGNAERAMKPTDFFMGPLMEEDHGNWVLSIYCKDIDDNWIEMFQTISILITEIVPLKVSIQKSQTAIGNSLEISFEYPIKYLETCELVAPSFTFDRYYSRSRKEQDKCGYILTNVTEEDEGLWKIIGVGRIIYKGFIQLKLSTIY